MFMSVLGPTSMKNAPLKKTFQNKKFLHNPHRQDTHASDTTSMYHSQTCSKTQVFVSIFAATMVSCPHKNSLPSKFRQSPAWATRRSRPRWVCRRSSAWRASRCRTTLGDHVVRKLVCVLFLVLSVPTSPSCAWFVRFFCGLIILSPALINASIATVPCCTVANVRKRLQASGIERGRSSVQEYMKAEHWRAKQVTCAFTYFCPPTSEESALDGVEQATAPGVVHIDVWSGLAKRRGRIRGSLLQDTQFSQFPRRFSLSSFPLCQRSSRRSLSCPWCWFPVTCTDFELFLSFRGWLCPHWDDGLASRRQLLQSRSSATSSGPTSPFSGCAKSPTIRTRGSVRGLPLISHSPSWVSTVFIFHAVIFTVLPSFQRIFWLFQSIHKTHFHPVTPKDLAVAQHFKNRRAWRWRDTASVDGVTDGDHARSDGLWHMGALAVALTLLRSPHRAWA